MDSRKLACIAAAGFIGITLIGISSSSSAKSPTVVIEGQRVDPELQRTVSYADLNLAFRTDQNVLGRRIQTTAKNLCFDLNGTEELGSCTRAAVHSTDDQVAAAIDWADRKMAGLKVGPAIAISMVVGVR